ncbi:MAG: B12-binding domain-containing radical SAM protein [Chitinophagales bacterium]|nr:B12-binding domain-containing radical SAM protein [Chitinophagales bacterium]
MSINKSIKVLFVNLPFPARFTRRYMCTYTSATSLFPPYELMAAAGQVRNIENTEIEFIDCIADEIDELQLSKLIAKFQPDIMLSLVGMDSFEKDISCINYLKSNFPYIQQVIFGHYPTTFPKEIIKKSKVDIVIMGEPDITICDIVNSFKSKDYTNVQGITYKRGNEIYVQQQKRIIDINHLALPTHDLIDATKYFEPFMPAPFGMIQTSRGCPFKCNFCVTTYGSKYTVKSPIKIIDELKWMIDLHQIKSFRIIDDTFTIQKKKVLDFCDLMIQNNLNLKWTCLSRVDTVTKEMLIKMKEAGCQRIYFGIESGSQEVLDYYRKDINRDKIKEAIQLCENIGIDTVGLFMTGLPTETEKDFQETLFLAKQLPLTFAGVGELTPYPGTDLYEKVKEFIDFSLFPYRLKFKEEKISSVSIKRRNIFHRSFYFRLNTLFKIIKTALKNPSTILPLIRNTYSSRKYSTVLYPFLHE